MLKSLYLENFKAFGEGQAIPLKPITLVFGANSAGKSSLIHSICLAHEAMKSGDLDVFRTSVGGESIDLGGFRQYVHRRDTQNWVEWGVDLDTANLTGRIGEIFASTSRVSVQVTIGIRHVDPTRKQQIVNPVTNQVEQVDVPTGGAPVPVGKPFITSYEIFADGAPVLRTSRIPLKNFRIDELNHQHSIFQEVIKALVLASTTTESLSAEDYSSIATSIDELVPEIEIEPGNFLPTGLVRSEDFLVPGGMMTFMPISKGKRSNDLANNVRLFIPNLIHDIVKGLTEAVYNELDRFSYLGPLRSYPPRHLAYAEHNDPNWESGGGSAWDKVRKNDELRERVNEWLSSSERLKTPYRLEVRRLFDVEELSESIDREVVDFDIRKTDFAHSQLRNVLAESGLEEKAQREILTDFLSRIDALDSEETEEGGLFDEFVERKKITDNATENLEPVNELSLIDLRSNTKVSHRDVGIGISQVLPVLVNSYASHNKIIAIEQPEIHLHPALQAELGDVFINSAKEQGNTFIIETHSEHLILRMMRRMRNTDDEELPNDVQPLSPDEIVVLYVQPGRERSNSVVSVIKLDRDGALLDPFPDGFFEEGFKERFS
jgi:predicted ATPase